MQEYTLGLVFSPDNNQIILITRGEHAFHTNKTNALGGKILIGESPLACVVREIAEEAHVETTEDDWTFMGIINGNTWKVWVFACHSEKKDIPTTIQEGTLKWTDIHDLPNTIIKNLKWIIPFAIDKYKDPELQSFAVWYTKTPKLEENT